MEDKKKWIERAVTYRFKKNLDTPSATVTWD